MCGFAGLYVMASQCYFVGRIDAAIRYTEAAEKVISTGGVKVPYGASGFVGGAYVFAGQPDRWIQWCRIRQACGDDLHVFITACLLVGLTVAGLTDEAVAAAQGLIDAAEATHNPVALSYALNAYGPAFGDVDPVRALEALRRGLVIAQDSGNRFVESHVATGLSQLEPEQGDPLAALDHITLAIGNFYDSGHVAYIRGPWQLSRYSSTASDASNRQPPSPVSHSISSPRRQSPNSAPRSLTSAMSSARRPTKRSPARVRR
jgi:hypothetical protein